MKNNRTKKSPNQRELLGRTSFSNNVLKGN